MTGLLYAFLKSYNDARAGSRAAKSGSLRPVGLRIGRRVTGRALGRGMGRMFR